MPKIFISHSTRDQQFARQLAADLIELGHQPWLDEWDIKVGECIVSKIQKGLDECEYVVVVLSESSVKSGWVDREWKEKYWDEVRTGKIMVLPVLIDNCEIPGLLKTKKYADFRKSHGSGMVHLMGAFSPVVKMETSVPVQSSPGNSEVSALIELVQSRSVPLSQCMAKALALANKIHNGALEPFCRNELVGWEDEARKKRPLHRVIQVYASLMEINMQYMGWGGSTDAALSYIKGNPDTFIPTKMVLPHSIADLEAEVPPNPGNKIMNVRGTAGDFFPNSERPDLPVFLYASGAVYAQVIESTRRELTKMLIEILPG